MKKSANPAYRGAGLVALTAAALTFSACSSSSSTPQTASLQQAAKQQPAPQPSGKAIPNIEKMQVAMLKKETADGNARMFASVSKDSKDVHAQGFFVLQRDRRDPKRDVTFTDDGKGADDQAGDGVFTAFVHFDFDELRKQNRRLEMAGGAGKVKVVSFEGRKVTKSDIVQAIAEADITPDNPIDATPLGLSQNISFEHSIVINHPDVVNDPNRTFDRCSGSGTPMGAWTFGHLWTEMINQPLTGMPPEDAARKWLDTWHSNQEFHFNSALARPGVQQFIDDWDNISGGTFDLKVAPFRLVAIVNRMDLHESVGYGGGSGETRFVFALEDANCNPLPFLVIFEYGNIQEDCDQMTDLARKWVELANEPVGSPQYNAMLQDITDLVTTRDANPNKPNGSALNQLRTNDFVFDHPWQLREFILDPGGSGLVVPETVKRTPDISLDNTPQLDQTIDDNLPTIWPFVPFSMLNILTGSFDPLEYPAGSGIFIRAMASDMPHPGFCFQANLAGNAAISADDARFEYSSNTCAGCHAGDVNAGGNFTHIDENGNLSQFLSGPHSESDCMSGTPRNFDEPTRRAQILDALANNACERLAMLKELHAEH